MSSSFKSCTDPRPTPPLQKKKKHQHVQNIRFIAFRFFLFPISVENVPAEGSYSFRMTIYSGCTDIRKNRKVPITILMFNLIFF